MNPEHKAQLHQQAQTHLDQLHHRISTLLGEAKKELDKILKNPNAYFPTFQAVRTLFNLKRQRTEDLSRAESSPYFARCDIRTAANPELETWYFGRQSVSEEKIYSWVVPAAALRFEDPGARQYLMPDGSTRQVGLERADQYLITAGQIRFMTTASLAAPRTMVYQEQFSRHKTGFVLPEIVEVMERAQDQVIRASWHGPFAVTGPAGSGKTTIALHRVAYLVQSPETAAKFPAEECIIFVNDESSRQYFAALMPELGIANAKVTTFPEWAMGLLSIDPAHFTRRYGTNESVRDAYEFAKSQALARATADDLSLVTAAIKPSTPPHQLLNQAWENYGLGDQLSLWQQQYQDGVYDRFDLALLLHAARHGQGRLVETVEYYDKNRSGKLLKKKSVTSIRFALAVLDEIQNWLPEEIQLVQGCLDPHTQAATYVGDLAQRTRLGTVRSWSDIDQLPESRFARLAKVYRNPKPVLEYIRQLGYQVEIPDGVKNGPPVRQQKFSTTQELITLIVSLTSDLADDQTLGVLCRAPEEIQEITSLLNLNQSSINDRVLLRTVHEAQGVEFDVVLLVGDQNAWLTTGHKNADQLLVSESVRVNRDLYYVALTRAMEQLVIAKRV